MSDGTTPCTADTLIPPLLYFGERLFSLVIRHRNHDATVPGLYRAIEKNVEEEKFPRP
jgi:hypothetical protein